MGFHAAWDWGETFFYSVPDSGTVFPGHLLKSSLRRPFQDPGISVRFSIRDNPGSQTLLNRRFSLVVQESGILRFLNRLSGTAVGDFLGPSEREANRFNADAFRALRIDVAAILQ